MPHALLLVGPTGIGKRRFAATLVQALSCARPQEDGRGCDSCTGCRLQRVGSHPDHRVLLPLEGKQAISVDQIRQLQAHLALKARQSRFKTVTIFPAEAMTLNAANSLLKVLEEPPGETLILLITSLPAKLPITVRSRCQRLELAVPKPQEAQAWLKEQCSCASEDLILLLALTEGAPLRAIEYAERGLMARRQSFIEEIFLLASGAAEPLAIAQSWPQEDVGESLYWIATLAGDMIRLKSGVSGQYLINRDRIDTLQLLAQNTPFHGLFALWNRVNSDWWLWKGQKHVNSQLLLEGLLIDWSLCFHEAHYGHT